MPKLNKILIGIVVGIVALVLISYAIYKISPYKFLIADSEGLSMSPTVLDKDKSIVLTSKRPNVTFGVNRGMVCVFYVAEDNEYISKRLIGLPGDTIKIEKGKLFINDMEISEPYVKFKSENSPTLIANVPEGHYFIMGDNRQLSSDSRSEVYDDNDETMTTFMLSADTGDPISKEHFVDASWFAGIEIFNLTQFRFLEHKLIPPEPQN